MLNRFYIKIVTFLILAISSGTSFANIFAVPPTDKSKEYLGMIFGGSVGAVSLGGNVNFTIFSAIIEKFNLVMLVFGVIFLGYITIVSTVNTAREGEALGKKFSLFTIFRPLMGILLMVPSYSSGYSVIQMSVMWIVLNGIGLADSAWNTILQHLSYGANITANVQHQAGGTKITPYHLQDLTKSVMIASACRNALNHEMPELKKMPGLFQQHGPIKIYVVPQKIQGNAVLDDRIIQTAEVKVGLEGAHAPYDHICGKFLVGVELKREDRDKLDFIETHLTSRLATKVQALLAMFHAVDTATSLLSKAHLNIDHVDKGYVNSAGEAYINQMTALTKNGAARDFRTNLTQQQKELRSYGWIHAGSYYHVITKAQKTFLDPELTVGKMVAIQPTVIPDEIYQLLTNDRNFNQRDKLLLAVDKIQRFWEKDRPLTLKAQSGNEEKPSQSISIENAKTTNDRVEALINRMVNEIHVPFVDYLKSIEEGDPLLALSRFGTALALDSEQSVFAGDLIAALGAAPHNLQRGPFLQDGYPAAGAVSGIRYLIIIIGATLGIYIPLVPYLVFLIAAFGWFIMVIEAIFLCPMLSLAFCYPAEEIFSKITHGLFIIMNVFLRPLLMVLGFIVGITLMRAGFSLLNFGFISALNAGTTSTVFSILAVLVVYVFIAMTLVNKSFSLIYLLANQVMRWIGGQPEHTDTDAIVREIKTGFDSTVGRDQALMNRAAAGLGGPGAPGARPANPPPPDF